MKPQLHMIRRNLNELPELTLPDGYALSSFQPDFEDHWTNIVSTCFEREPEKFCFDAVMRNDPAFKPERVWFVVHGKTPVATSSAYHRSDFLPDYGMIHYVGALSGHKGKKLGYWVSLACLHQMRREHREGAWLSTDDFRLAAVKTYLNLDFVPLLVHENQRNRWRNVFESLGAPELSEKFQEELSIQVASIRPGQG